MAKIKVAHFSAGSTYLYAIDHKGRIWKRAVNGGVWQQDGKLPEMPEGDKQDFQLRVLN